MFSVRAMSGQHVPMRNWDAEKQGYLLRRIIIHLQSCVFTYLFTYFRFVIRAVFKYQINVQKPEAPSRANAPFSPLWESAPPLFHKEKKKKKKKASRVRDVAENFLSEGCLHAYPLLFCLNSRMESASNCMMLVPVRTFTPTPQHMRRRLGGSQGSRRSSLKG